jgi:hypothetical protein
MPSLVGPEVGCVVLLVEQVRVQRDCALQAIRGMRQGLHSSLAPVMQYALGPHKCLHWYSGGTLQCGLGLQSGWKGTNTSGTS